MRRILVVGCVVAAGWLLAAPAEAASTAAIVDYAYAPNPLRVPAGTTVTWVNEDVAPHTVTSSTGPTALRSPELGKGQSWSYTFATPGTYAYYCAVHPTMRGTIEVDGSAGSAPSVSAAPTPRLITTTTTSSPGGPRINPLLFLAAIVAGIVVVGILAIAG